MSEQLLGEAGAPGPRPGTPGRPGAAPQLDGDGAHATLSPGAPGAAGVPSPVADGSSGLTSPAAADGPVEAADGSGPKPRRRRRGSRGGRSRHGAAGQPGADEEGLEDGTASSDLVPGAPLTAEASRLGPVAASGPVPLPEKAALPARPKIGDTRPGSPPVPKRRRPAGGGLDADAHDAHDAADSLDTGADMGAANGDDVAAGQRPRRARRRRPGAPEILPVAPAGAAAAAVAGAGLPMSGRAGRPVPTSGPQERSGGRPERGGNARGGNARGGNARGGAEKASPSSALDRFSLDQPLEKGARRGSSDRRNRPLGRYLMVVHVGPTATQIAVLEGRTLIEHYVSRPADDATQIDGNIYLGRVQNVLPGMEAAFVDIGTPKNAVLYRGDLRYDDDEVGPATDDVAKPTRGRLGGAARDARIEQLLRTGQSIVCQVTKNPIGTKGARLTQEVSLPGRFVVLIPTSDTYGISKRLGDDERKRLRKILDDIRPVGHGLIVRTAAEGASADELGRDVARLMRQWDHVQQLAQASRAPQLLYREPDLAVRVIREEFNRDYRGVVVDDPHLYEQVKEYVVSITPELADRVELVAPGDDPLPLFERFRVHEQVHKALDRKVWLPSGGSLIIERTEALTVIDVNTGKNVGTSNLEETVFRNNLEAAEEIARQLRLRDIGGIIVIDFIDMEIVANRAEVIRTFRESLARDKTRSQVFDISELGLVEMTRKRISEGLVESYSETCPTCGGRGIVFDESLL